MLIIHNSLDLMVKPHVGKIPILIRMRWNRLNWKKQGVDIYLDSHFYISYIFSNNGYVNVNDISYVYMYFYF